MSTYCIYIHRNKINGKVYIGQTNNTKRRWRNGGIEYKPVPGRVSKFWNAICKYGWQNFEHKVLIEGLSQQEANLKEIELIAKYDSTNHSKGYNISKGGNGGKIYKHHPRGMLGKHQSMKEIEGHRAMLLDHDKNPMTNGKCVWGKTHEHPRGMLGKHQTAKQKKAASSKKGYQAYNHKCVAIYYPDGRIEHFPSVSSIVKKYKIWQIYKMIDTGKPYELPRTNMPNRSKYQQFAGCIFKSEDTEISNQIAKG